MDALCQKLRFRLIAAHPKSPVRYLKVALCAGRAPPSSWPARASRIYFHPLDLALWSFLGRASTPPWVHRSPGQYLLVIALSFAIAWTTIDIHRRSLKIVVGVGALLQMISIAWVLNLYRIFFSPFPGIMAILLSFGAGFAYSRSEGGKRKRVVRLMFGERVSTEDLLFTHQL